MSHYRYVPAHVNYTVNDGEYWPRLDNVDNKMPTLRFRLLLAVLPYCVPEHDRDTARFLRARGADYFLRSYYRQDQVRNIRAAVRAFRASYLFDILSQQDFIPPKNGIMSDSSHQCTKGQA